MRTGPRRLAAASAAALCAAAAALGLQIARRGSTRPPDRSQAVAEAARTPPGMVYVAGGWCWIGTNDPDADEDARPMRRVFVPSFYIDRTEVTNAQFKAFRPAHAFPRGEENRPVTNVTYDEAAAYARWAGRRLPTEDEWEKAARGPDGRRYPWGSAWDPRRVARRAVGRLSRASAGRDSAAESKSCALGSSRLHPVGSAASGASPYGCLDMAGNAWEWVQGFYNGNPDQRILRGGAVGYGEHACRTYARTIEGSGAT